MCSTILSLIIVFFRAFYSALRFAYEPFMNKNKSRKKNEKNMSSYKEVCGLFSTFIEGIDFGTI